LVAIVFAAVLAAYQPVWHAGFIWNDDLQVTANPCVVGPLGFADIWTGAAASHSPLTTTTFWILNALWGLSPLPYHLADVLLHAASAVLLWLVLRRLRVPGAWFGALLWALHPVQVNSAAWISEIGNAQSAVFYLLSIWCFLGWLEARTASGQRRQVVCCLAAVLCAALAVLSSPSTVMLPVVLGLCWWWTSGEWRWRNLLWLAPFLAVSIAAGGWTISEQQFHAGSAGPDWNHTAPEQLIAAGNAVWFYLGKLIWPSPLIFVYPRWEPVASQLTAYLPALAAVAAWLGLWWYRSRLRPVFFAATYFGISLVPALGFFGTDFQRYSFVGDHFQYLASMGILALVGAGLATALGRLRIGGAMLQPALGAEFLLGLGALTWLQAHTYANDGILWRTTIEENPGCWIAHTNLGAWLVKEGNNAGAIDHLEQALRLKPGFYQAQSNLGLALFKSGRPAEAIPCYRNALKTKPDDAETLGNLGDALAKLRHWPEAISCYELSLLVRPAAPIVQNNLGVLLMQSNRVDEAVPHLQEAVRLKPAYAGAENNLGNALIELGRTDDGVRHLKAAVRAQPEFADARFNLGVALVAMGQPDEGIKHLQQAVQLNPDDRDAQFDLGIALMGEGRLEPAADHLQQAVSLKPADAQAHSRLGRALLGLGRTAQAAAQFREALRLDPAQAEAQEGLDLAQKPSK
jgi:tetratricopeptide (TPR) repeat protein